jgi:cytoskeleton protein RodZ
MDALKLYELGRVLKEHRERCGFLREDIALRIKISLKNLHAIEEGLADQLPQAVFTRSFIRSYAELVKMAPDEVDRLLAEVFPPKLINNINPRLTSAAREQSVTINSPQPVKKMSSTIAAVVLIMLLGLLAWFYFSHIRPADPPAPESSGTVQSRPAAGEQSASAAGSVGALPQNEPQNEQNEQDTEIADSPAPGGQPSPASSEAFPQPGPPAGGTGSEAAPAAAGPSAPAREQNPLAGGAGQNAFSPNPALSLPRGEYAHRVMVSVISANCWIESKIDGENSRSLELQPGRTFFADFQERATIRLGNAAAVKVFFDGKEIAFRAAEGEIKLFRFPYSNAN